MSAKLLDAFHCRRPAARADASPGHLLTLPHGDTFDHWLASLPDRPCRRRSALCSSRGHAVAARREGAKAPASLTYQRTAKRAFEVAYWKTIAALAEGRYLNKNNADCVHDAITQEQLPYHDRQTDALGDYLLDYYRKQIAAAEA